MSLYSVLCTTSDVPQVVDCTTKDNNWRLCFQVTNLFVCAGALLWFCCRRRDQHNHPGAKLSSSQQGSPLWGGASSAALIKRPFRKAPPKNLVASKAVDLSPALMDPEQPSFTTGQHQTVPGSGHTPAQFYTQQISVSHPAETSSSPSAHQTAGRVSDLPVALGARGVQHGPGGVQHEGLDKAGMAHSDSAVSLPSNASSVQGPGTPIAPAVGGAGQCAAYTSSYTSEFEI